MNSQPNQDTLVATLSENITITDNTVYKGRIEKEQLLKILEESGEDVIYVQAMISEGSLMITVDEFEFSHFM